MRFILPLPVIFFISFSSCNQHPVADRIYFNAKIWTGDSTNPEANAIADQDSMILYVGNDCQSYAGISSWAKLDSFVKINGRGNDLLRWGGLKGFVDGSLGSTTAWFYKPYLDAPNSTGLQVTDTSLLRKWILSADSVGLHIACHAIGDRANDWILNVYEEAEKLRPDKDHRFRVEHAQHLTQDAIEQFARLKVVPSMQPFHAIDDGKWAAKRLDTPRLRRTYVFKSLLESKANLTFGSDWPVAPLDPIAGIYAAVTRRTLDDKNPGGWFPEQKITVEQALRCNTVNNAWAGFQEMKT